MTGKNTGTEAFSKLHAGIAVEVLGPLGNGFPLYEAEGKRVFLMGGGIGIPPMLQTAKELNAEKTAVLGYRDELFLNEEFEKYADVFVATEDGSAGTKGNVMDAIRENALEADVIFACGPTPMLRAIKNYAEENNIPCWISMEERMACGVGACLALSLIHIFPLNWTVINTNTWSSAPYTASFGMAQSGDYTLKVTFQLQKFDGAAWKSIEDYASCKVPFHVSKASVTGPGQNLTPAADRRNAVRTGDSTPVLPFVIILVVAAVAIGGVIIYKKKK